VSASPVERGQRAEAHGRPLLGVVAGGGTTIAPGDAETAVAHLAGIGLAEVDSRAALQQRFDRKYLLSLEAFGSLMRDLGDSWSVLEIEGRRVLGYESTYFDTPLLTTYRAHLQGRRRRYKIRVRRYVDTATTMLEVKVKGPSGLTLKERIRHPAEHVRTLGPVGEEFITETLQGYYAVPAPEGLRPTLTTTNTRVTLVSLGEPTRLTIDADLICDAATGVTACLRPGRVLVESKAGRSGSEVDQVLRRLGERPTNVSKYCVGVALTHPELPSNPWHRVLRRHFTTASNG
jgi:hypothetical protein